MDEHFNQTLQSMLVKFVQNKKEDWDLFIDTSIFAYNTSHHESTSYTPFDLMFGRRAYLPVELNMRKTTLNDLLNEKKQENMIETIDRLTRIRKLNLEGAKIKIQEAQKKQKHYYDLKHAKSEVYKIGAKVLLKDLLRKKRKGGKLDSKWLGPFKIRKNLGKGLYYISDDRNIKAALKRVHGTHLKLYYCSSSISDKVKKSIDVLEASQEMFHSQNSSSANILTSTPIKSFVYGSFSSQLKGHQRISYQLLLITHFSRPTVLTLKILLITCQHVMYLNHLCRLIITLWSLFNDQVSDSPQEKCQQKRIRSFEVASHQRIDCQKDDLLLNSLLCNDSPSSVSKTSLCESVSIVCHDNMPLNSHTAVSKQRNHCKTSSGVESKSIHYSIHPSGSVLNPIIAENVKETSVKYWLKDLGLTMDDYCLITDGEWLTDI